MLSINDPVTIEFNEKHGYYLSRGRETFYNEDREWITFDSPEEAKQWAMDNLGVVCYEQNAESGNDQSRDSKLENAGRSQALLPGLGWDEIRSQGSNDEDRSLGVSEKGLR